DLENVEYVRSRSFRERSSVLVKFLDDSDYNRLYAELRFKVLGIQNDLPASMDPPYFTKIDVNEWLPVINVNLVGNRTNRALSLMGDELKLRLERIDGVKDVTIDGEFTREFHVELDPERLMRFGVTYNDVSAALQAANVSIPAGDFQSLDGEYVIVVDQRFRSREDVAAVIVRSDSDGSFVTVGDVLSGAKVSYRDPFIMSSVNGQDSVSLKVRKTPEGNALDISDRVREVVDGYEPVLVKEGVHAVLTQDQRVYIDESMSTLGMNLLAGIILVSGILWWVMGFRNAALTTAGIPFSFLVTMIFMWVTDNSLNEITLFSFVLVSGIIVDDAIVVVENIYRHLQEGKELRQAVVDGTTEVFLPVLSATTTTVAAFLPMLIMTGSIGEFFAQVPKAVSFAIMASLVECLIILPSHVLEWPGAANMSRSEQRERPEPRFMLRLRQRVNGLLTYVLRHRMASLGIVLGSFVVAVLMLGVSVAGKARIVRIKFFPDDYNLFYVDLIGPAGTSLHETATKGKDLSRFIAAMGGGVAKNATCLAGMVMNDDYENVYGTNSAFVIVEMPAKEDQDFPGNPDNDPLRYLNWMREQLRPFEQGGWTLRVWPEKTGPPAGKAVNIRILGSDFNSVSALKDAVWNFVTGSPDLALHLVGLQVDSGTPNRVFRFEPNRARIAEYGLGVDQVAGLAASVLDGRFVGKYRLSDEDVDLRLKIDPKALEQPEQALDIPVLEHDSGPVRLGDLCAVRTYREPGQLNRYQGQRAITMTADVTPGAPVSAQEVAYKVRSFYETIRDQYPGATVDFAGEFESTGKSFTSLAYAFMISVLLIYTILACQFHSYIQPVIIISAIVFALIGVVFGVVLSRSLFTINSFIATIGVAGVVVNDSLVLLDFINKRYAAGLSRSEAIFEGVRVRLRPILLTTATTTLGLLPMALGFPYYSNVWSTMATTFVTGLCTATGLSIFMVPVMWDLLMGYSERRRKTG
ncbi:MAG: efflux RND transporter permease subunit, partial [Proteobacteria bacterium]|nr:efflux RND transporter permease subunit [Pseudomonadota bacterium]